MDYPRHCLAENGISKLEKVNGFKEEALLYHVTTFINDGLLEALCCEKGIHDPTRISHCKE